MFYMEGSFLAYVLIKLGLIRTLLEICFLFMLAFPFFFDFYKLSISNGYYVIKVNDSKMVIQLITAGDLNSLTGIETLYWWVFSPIMKNRKLLPFSPSQDSTFPTVPFLFHKVDFKVIGLVSLSYTCGRLIYTCTDITWVVFPF